MLSVNLLLSYGSFFTRGLGGCFSEKMKVSVACNSHVSFPSSRPYRVVIGVKLQFYRLFAQVNDLTETTANRDGPLAPARDPVRRDIGRRAYRPSIREMIADDRIDQ